MAPAVSSGGKSLIVSVGTGFIFGLGFAVLFLDSMNFVPDEFKPRRPILKETDTNIPPSAPPSSGEHKEAEKVDKISGHDGDGAGDDDRVARELFNEVRVVCWVMTMPASHKDKVIAVKETWGSRCNKLVFVSTEEDTNLGIIKAGNFTEHRDWLWTKTKEAYKYVWAKYKDEADWFLKADDDTFVIMENLRYFLSDKNPADPVHYGCRFIIEATKPEGYMSGGAGYVLSKEATRRFVEVAVASNNDSICYTQHGGPEDVQIGRCLMSVGVHAGDSRDQLGRHRFFSFDLTYFAIEHTESMMPEWYPRYMMYPFTTGRECCSETTISFHYIDPKQMRFLYHLVYYIYPYGITRQHLFNRPMVNGKKTKFLR